MDIFISKLSTPTRALAVITDAAATAICASTLLPAAWDGGATWGADCGRASEMSTGSTGGGQNWALPRKISSSRGPLFLVKMTWQKYWACWYISNVSIIFDAPCLFIHHFFVFCCTSWRFYAFSGTNLLTRCHSASSLFFAVFVFQKSYTGNILGIGRNKSRTSHF
jgi:hypothetical protein